MKNVVLYIRSNTVERLSKNGVRNQKKECLNYISQRGWNLLKIFKEKVTSSKHPRTTGMSQLMKFCRENKEEIGFVVVYDINRFAQTPAELISRHNYFRKLGITVFSVTRI